MKDDHHLGLDLSMQDLTFLLLRHQIEDLQTYTINFDQSYPYYKNNSSVLVSHDSKVVHSNPIVWIESFDNMLRLLIK